MNSLVWTPQRAFAPFFITEPEEIIEHRSIFKQGVVYHVPHGGRGSAKTWTFADALVVEASLRPVRILVTREFQISIEESIKDEIESAITNRGLDYFFDCQKSVIIGKNGSRFIFKGIKNNIKNLKSISNVDIVLCEEAEDIQRDSWEKLLPSIRPKSGKDPIFIIIFNPADELDDTYQRWVVSPPPQTVSLLINWRDNKYFPAYLERQRVHAKKTLPPKDYEHIWEGVPRGPGGDVIIDRDWIRAAKFASKHPDFVKAGTKKVGYDPAGQGRDCHASVFIDGNCLEDIDEWLISKDLRVASRRAVGMARRNDAGEFIYDECGGFGDGVAVFVEDNIDGKDKTEDGDKIPSIELDVYPFNAGDGIINPDEEIEGTDKSAGETYSNQKAHAHGIVAQLLYNTFRFIELGERGIEPTEMLSIDIEDAEVFTKLMREMSTPIWVKSEANSKKKVESKKDMEKRTGLPSPNCSDAVIMCFAPRETKSIGLLMPSRYQR